MAHLIKKIVKGRTYWYARECQRVNGRVVTVWQRYLGTADSIIARLAQPPRLRRRRRLPIAATANVD